MKKSIIVSMSLICAVSVNAQEDPYIWLEEVESDKSMEWVSEQNTAAVNVLHNVSGFNDLASELEFAYNNPESIDYPTVIGDMVYNFKQTEEHPRGIWRRTNKDLYMDNTCEWETILDLDNQSEIDEAKWVWHGATWLKPDMTKCLISLSDGGTDESIVREFNVETMMFEEGGFDLPSSKGSVAWVSENEILISRDFGEGSLTASGYPNTIKILKRGQKFEDAKTVIEGGGDIMGIWASSSYHNNKYTVTIAESKSFYERIIRIYGKNGNTVLDIPNNCQIQGRTSDQMILKLMSDWSVEGNEFKQGDVISLNTEQLYAGKHKARLVFRPDAKSSVEGVRISKGFILINTIQNVTGVLYSCTFEKDTWLKEKVNAPELGRIALIEGSSEETGYFYQYSNFITPPTLYFQDGDKRTIVREGRKEFKTDNLIVHQYEAKSKDGTMIPYFIVHDKNIKMDGTNPTLISAYGGFNVSNKPRYSSTTGIGWLEKGGVYVLANIRGGGEFGPSWHQAAIKEKRQNAYDDFYAVSEDLIAKKITSPEHLGAYGWSNGGLMAGVISTQRPDLFNAVIIGAPLLDMKRFNKMLAGASWMGEYGNPDIPEEWDFIKKYSPYHNVHAEKEYPEVFFVTSTKDDRVHPAHARKMAARMIEQGHKILYYETIEGGHGASSTNEQAALNQAMMYSYLKMKLM